MVNAALTSAVQSLPNPDWQSANLHLTFNLPSGDFYTDSAGNELQRFTKLEITASVKPEKKQPTSDAMPGSGQYTLILEGRMISPKNAPSNIGYENKAVAKYVDQTSGQAYTGEFRLLPNTQNRISEVTKKFGQKIRGELFVRGAV